MDDKYLFRTARYIEMNPVKAGLVDLPEDYRWSSAAVHLSRRDDSLVRAASLLDKSVDWGQYLHEADSDEFKTGMIRHQRTGRPFGGTDFLEKLETLLDRDLKLKKPGRKPRKGVIGGHNT